MKEVHMKRTSTKVIAAFLLGASVAGGIATAATSEPLGVKVCVDKRTQAIYLAGSNGCSTTRTAITLGAPTIDVKSIASLVTPSVVSIKVVAAAGLYTPEIGRMVGVRIPIIPMSHQYLVTTAFREVDKSTPHLPTLRDPDNLVYYREDGAGLVMGGYERQSAPAFLNDELLDQVPFDFNGKLLTEDWSRLEEIAVNSAMRVPAMEHAPIRKIINGPEAFTPDNEFCMGESSVKGFFVAAGFCAHGIAAAGGVVGGGMAMGPAVLAAGQGNRTRFLTIH